MRELIDPIDCEHDKGWYVERTAVRSLHDGVRYYVTGQPQCAKCDISVMVHIEGDEQYLTPSLTPSVNQHIPHSTGSLSSTYEDLPDEQF